MDLGPTYHLILYCLESYFWGFSILSMCLAISTVRRRNGKTFLSKIDKASVWAVRYLGVLYAVLWLIIVYYSLTHSSDIWDRYTMINRFWGASGIGFWGKPLTFFFLTQLLWIQKVNQYRWAKPLFAIPILIMIYAEQIVIMITSLHRDYLPSSWAMYAPTLIESVMSILTHSGIFLVMLGGVWLIWNKCISPPSQNSMIEK